jgi:serine/threonine protein kinase
MPLVSGEQLGHYKIQSLIGKGGMGEVYRASDTRLERDVAIKVCAAQFTERFEREARIVATLNHPNICTLYDVGPNLLVMELIDGPTLADRIREGRVPLDEAMKIARQIAAALEQAHAKNVVHRDLKPGNVKIKPDGLVKVLDFGLAKAGAQTSLGSNDSPTITLGLTQAGEIMGTPAYMSPEQAKGKEVDRRADIWAFGAVLYEMLTGKRLFEAADFSETFAAVIRGDIDVTRAQGSPASASAVPGARPNEAAARHRRYGPAAAASGSRPNTCGGASAGAGSRVAALGLGRPGGAVPGRRRYAWLPALSRDRTTPDRSGDVYDRAAAKWQISRR